uniref:Uncharacterized protein n=1 Tax=Ciona savignyi TaxID=51511 RepID=H2ZFN8_CIOSA
MEGVALRGLDIVLERLDDIIQQDFMASNSLKLDLSTKKKLKVAQTARKSAKYCPTVFGPSPDTTPPIQHLEPTKSNGTSPVMAKETSIKRFAKQNGISVKVEKPQPKEFNGTPKTKMLQNGANIPPKAIKLQSGAYILPKSIMLQKFANGPPKPTMLQSGMNEETPTHQLNNIQTSNTTSTTHSTLSTNSTPKTTSKASTPTTLTSTNLMLTKPTTNSTSKTDSNSKSGLTLT